MDVSLDVFDDRRIKIGFIVLVVLIFVSVIVASGAVVDPEEELVGSLTYGELFVWVGAIAMAVLGLAIVSVGGKGLLMAGRIALNDPVPAGQAHQTDDVIEVQGTAEPIDKTTGSKYTKTECLAHTWKTKQKRNRVGDDGPSDTWSTVDEGQYGVPFYVTDETGKVAVDPGGASMSLASHMERKSRGGTYRTRKYEGRLEVGDTVHVYGQRREAGNGQAPGDGEVYIGDGDGTFKISDTTGKRTVLRSTARGLAFTLFGVLVLGIAFAFVLG